MVGAIVDADAVIAVWSGPAPIDRRADHVTFQHVALGVGSRHIDAAQTIPAYPFAVIGAQSADMVAGPVVQKNTVAVVAAVEGTGQQADGITLNGRGDGGP